MSGAPAAAGLQSLRLVQGLLMVGDVRVVVTSCALRYLGEQRKAIEDAGKPENHVEDRPEMNKESHSAQPSQYQLYAMPLSRMDRAHTRGNPGK